MNQFFIETSVEHPQLSPAQLHQCRRVLKFRSHERFLVVDQSGRSALVYFSDIQDDQLHVDQFFDRLSPTLPPITLCVSLIRSERLEWMIQKASESGVQRIVLVDSERCVMKIKEQDISKKLARYRKIAMEASEQCLRKDIPLIEGVYSLEAAAQFKSDINVVCYENQKGNHIVRFVEAKKSMSIFVGPEGGYSSREIAELSNLGYHVVGLGPRIYRAESASIYCLNVISGILEGQDENS